MQIVLSILGSIFTVLLWILGILLFLLLIFLFTPVCYSCRVEHDKDTKARGRVTWLGGLLWLPFTFEEGEFVWRIRIFGLDIIKIFKNRKKKVKKRKKSAKKNKTEKKVRPVEVEERKEESASVVRTSEVKEETDKTGTTKTTVRKEKSDKTTARKKICFIKRLRSGWKKCKDGFWRLKTLLRAGFDKWSWLKKLVYGLKKENTRQMVCILRDNVLHLWRKLKPKVIKGQVLFGTGDPCTTGQILGGIAVFYACYGTKISVTPDFERKIFQGNLYIRGRISLITIIIILVRILLSQEWKQFRKDFEELKEAM